MEAGIVESQISWQILLDMGWKKFDALLSVSYAARGSRQQLNETASMEYRIFISC
jgi:hypothetical protein